MVRAPAGSVVGGFVFINHRMLVESLRRGWSPLVSAIGEAGEEVAVGLLMIAFAVGVRSLTRVHGTFLFQSPFN